jgi:hypothetical protein
MRKQPVDVVRRFLHTPPCAATLSSLVAKGLPSPAVGASASMPQKLPLETESVDCVELLEAAVALLQCAAARRMKITSIFGAGGNVAAFGTIARTKEEGDESALPFSLLVKVAYGRITHLQYLDGEPDC